MLADELSGGSVELLLAPAAAEQHFMAGRPAAVRTVRFHAHATNRIDAGVWMAMAVRRMRAVLAMFHASFVSVLGRRCSCRDITRSDELSRVQIPGRTALGKASAYFVPQVT